MPATLLVAAGIVVLSWPYTLAASIGIDESWRAVLHVTGPLGLQFGRDIVFTYGPLGFLSVPTPIFGASSILAIGATAAAYFALTATLLVLARRLLPLWAAAFVILLTARLYPFLPPFEALQAGIFVWGVEAIIGRRRTASEAPPDAPAEPAAPAPWGSPAREDLIAVGAGILTAVLITGKLNVGVFGGAMLLVVAVAIGRPWWRGLLAFAAAAGLSVVVVWLVTGQALANLPAFIVGSLEIVRGYSEAMVVDTHPTLRWVYAAYAIVVGLLAWIGWLAIRDRDRRTILAIAALGAILVFAEWKTAFTRNFTFYAMTTALVAVFPLASRLRSADRRTVAGTAFALVFAASLATSRVDPLDLVDVRDSLRSVAATAASIAPWRLADSVERTREELRGDLAIPDELLAHLRGETVHVDPWQTIAVVAYPEMRWAPLPIFQSYSAYTTALDETNADRLRDPATGPSRVLRERVDDVDGTPLAVDRRFAWFESPETTLETVCRFDELAANERWQVLRRTGRSCGEPEPLGSVVARAGETVTVPVETRPDRLVIVRVSGFPSGIVDRLRAVLFRSDEWYVELSGRGRFRLVPGTAADGLLLAVPMSLGWHERFAFGAPIGTIAVSAGRYGEASDATLTFDFLSVPLQTDHARG